MQREFRFLPLGGTQVGASCYLYKLGSTRLLIDCGVQPGLLDAESLPRLELLKDSRPDALIITHAHSDHIGAIPVVKLLFPSLPVYMTEATARITLPMLLDAARVAQRNGSPMYDEADVVKALQQVTTFVPDVPFEIGEVKLTPRISGHIVGAVGLMLEHRSGFRVWHTADFNTVATPTTDAAYLPPVPEEVDVVVTETTYGNLELPSRKKQNGDFIAQVRKVLGAGGRVLVPTFALGRAQDVLLTLTRQLPGTPVYLDGLTREITRLFASMPEHLPEGVRNQLKNGTNPFFGPQVTLVEDRREREYLIHNPTPAVILASSGMLSQGVSPLYAKHMLQEPGSAVLIVGYQDAESAGRQLLEGRNELMLNGEAITVSSHVERFYLSAHADRLGIANHLSRYPSERLMLTHGEGGAREAVFDLLHKERHVDRPRVGEWVDLVGETRVRRKMAPSPTVKRGATRIRRYKTEVGVTHEGNRVVIELPETFDLSLFPEGSYRLEANLAAIASLKLVERPGGVAKEVTRLNEVRSEGDEPTPESEKGLEPVPAVTEQNVVGSDDKPLQSCVDALKALQVASSAQARNQIAAQHPELQQAITWLREQEQWVLELTCWQGMTFQAAGETLELSESRVGQLYKRALRKLVYVNERAQARGVKTLAAPRSVPTVVQSVHSFVDAVTAEDRLEAAKQSPDLRPPHPYLTKDEDRVLELVFWQGLDYGEAAARIGFPKSKVARLRHSAARKMVEHVEKNGAA